MDENHVLTVQDLHGLDASDKAFLKRRCQTDLFYLVNNVLRQPKQKPLLRRVHGGICDTLVQKDPDKPFEEWSTVKERVILSSRGTLKSTIEIADIVQIILCMPDVRILLLSGRLDLAVSIMTAACEHFAFNKVLEALFPEFCTNVKYNTEEFWSPARTVVGLRDATIKVATFGSVKAGWHGEYVKLDDCTNEINQATPELVAKSIEHYDDLDPLLEPGGYTDFTGTPWAMDDLPEHIRRNGEEMEEETGTKHVLYFFQPIWKVKKVDRPDLPSVQQAQLQEERDDRERRNRLMPEDVDLLWPEKLSAKFLWPKYRKNPRKFACQYLLNPGAEIKGVFTHQLLVEQTKSIEDMPFPHQSVIVINWDLSGISGKGDFAVGAVGIWEITGRLFIIDCVFEKFTTSTAMCSAILNLFKKWEPDYHRIEQANGSNLISGELTTLAQRMKFSRAFYPGWDIPINEKDAKSARIRILAGGFVSRKIELFAGIPDLHEIYKQCEKFTGRGKYKDDGPDCLAQMYEKWKDMIGPKAVGYLTPSGAVVDFQSEGPNIHDSKLGEDEEVDPHADEQNFADVDFLRQFTVPSGR